MNREQTADISSHRRLTLSSALTPRREIALVQTASCTTLVPGSAPGHTWRARPVRFWMSRLHLERSKGCFTPACAHRGGWRRLPRSRDARSSPFFVPFSLVMFLDRIISVTMTTRLCGPTWIPQAPFPDCVRERGTRNQAERVFSVGRDIFATAHHHGCNVRCTAPS